MAEVDKQRLVTNDQSTQRKDLWQFGQVIGWAKQVLLYLVSEQNGCCLEFCCAEGLDLGKFIRVRPRELCSIDASKENIAKARDWYHQKQVSFPVTYIQIDIFKEPISKSIGSSKKFDVVTCFEGMENCFENNDTAKMLLSNASCRMKEGGFFIGIVPDSSTIWRAELKKEEQSSAASSVYADPCTFV